MTLGPHAAGIDLFAIAAYHKRPLFCKNSGCFLKGRVLHQGFMDIKGQLGGRTDQVPFKYLRVIRIHHGRLGGPLHEILGVVHEILVQGIFPGHHDQGGILAAAPYPAASLPRGYDGPGIPHQQAEVQITDINTQLQGTGGYHRQQIAPGQSGLYGPSFFRQKTGPVGADLAAEGTGAALGPHGDQLGHLA